jgi:hypothetical protein
MSIVECNVNIKGSSQKFHIARQSGRSQGGWVGLSPPPDINKKNYAKTTTNFSFSFCDYNFKYFGTCNTPLERCFQDLSNGILQAPKFQKFQLVKPKKICSHLVTAKQACQNNCNGKMTMPFTSALKES